MESSSRVGQSPRYPPAILPCAYGQTLEPGNCQKYNKKLKVYFYKLSTLFDLRRQVTSCSSVFMIRAGMYLLPPTVREHLTDILPSSPATRPTGSIFHSQS